jgi:hypothetical protein
VLLVLIAEFPRRHQRPYYLNYFFVFLSGLVAGLEDDLGVILDILFGWLVEWAGEEDYPGAVRFAGMEAAEAVDSQRNSLYVLGYAQLPVPASSAFLCRRLQNLSCDFTLL